MTKTLAVIFGVVFVIVGVVGFIPNPIIGNGAYFNTGAIHNLIHLVVGIILLIASTRGERSSALWLKIFGIVYILLFIDGLIQPGALLGFVMANNHDNWLHLLLGILLLIAGFSSTRTSPMVIIDNTTV